MGRFVAGLLGCSTAALLSFAPAQAAEASALTRFTLSDFRLAAGRRIASDVPQSFGSAPGAEQSYPTEVPRVPADDALPPPQILWNPSPASMVKVVPVKVRYKLRF